MKKTKAKEPTVEYLAIRSVARLCAELSVMKARVKTCLETLDAIASTPRCRRASSLARSTATFIRECESERNNRVK